jgi:hypothetical protein
MHEAERGALPVPGPKQVQLQLQLLRAAATPMMLGDGARPAGAGPGAPQRAGCGALPPRLLRQRRALCQSLSAGLPLLLRRPC